MTDVFDRPGLTEGQKLALQRRRLEQEREQLVRESLLLVENLPGLHEREVELWAWCEDPMCEGVERQVRVRGIWTRHNVTCGELSGEYDGPYARQVERSHDYYKFADETEAPCELCQKPRAVGPQERPTYARKSGHDPRRLLQIARGLVKVEPMALPQREQESQVADLQRELAELRALVKGNGNGHAPAPAPELQLRAPEPESPIGEPQPDPDPPTRSNAWTTVEPHIYKRPLKSGGHTFVVKVNRVGKTSAATLEEARATLAQMLTERDRAAG